MPVSRGTALITGASSGIGEALARQFAANEFDLIITARRETRLQEIATELGTEVKIVSCDLASPAGVDHLIAEVGDAQIDVLVNNAGIAHNGFFQDQTTPDIENLLALNISALTQLTHHFLPGMINRGAGKILNVASMASFQPVPSLAVYAASKAFVLSLTESLSEELRDSGVSVTALCPGLTQTDLLDEIQGSDIPPILVSSATDVARQAYDALMNREVIRIPGFTNQAAIGWAKHQPRWLIRGMGGLFARFGSAGRAGPRRAN